MNNGEWVRRAAQEERVVVTDRGRPVASLVPFRREDAGPAFAERKLLPEFEALPTFSGDSSRYVSEDRDRP